MEGAIFVDKKQADSSAVVYQTFYNNYVRSYGNPPDFFAQYTYETVFNTLTLMDSIGSSDPLVVRDAMLEKSRFEGLFGDIVLDSLGDAVRELGYVTIRDGAFHPWK